MGLEKKKAIKYHMCPGFVAAKIDDEYRFIAISQLAELYGLKRTEWTTCGQYASPCRTKNIQHLYPRYDGDYKLEERKNDHAR